MNTNALIEKEIIKKIHQELKFHGKMDIEGFTLDMMQFTVKDVEEYCKMAIKEAIKLAQAHTAQEILEEMQKWYEREDLEYNFSTEYVLEQLSEKIKQKFLSPKHSQQDKISSRPNPSSCFSTKPADTIHTQDDDSKESTLDSVQTSERQSLGVASKESRPAVCICGHDKKLHGDPNLCTQSCASLYCECPQFKEEQVKA